MTTYWFKPKRYGYGATPTTWQGWAVIGATVLAMIAVNLFLRPTQRHLWTLAALVAFDAVALGTLFIVSYRKTEGGLRWRWGDR